MALAKYAEDNLEIFYERMANRQYDRTALYSAEPEPAKKAAASQNSVRNPSNKDRR